MRIFLSLGMRGRDENDVLRDIKEATIYIKRLHPDCEVINTYRQEGTPEDVGPTYYLGKSIQILGSCDQVWFLNDWKNYRGCRVEHEVCKIYGIPCYILDLCTVRLDDHIPLDRIGAIRVSEALDTPKNLSAYQTFQFFKQSISNARDAIEDTKNLVSEYKDLYPNANLLLDASETAISLGLNTIDHLIHIIENDEIDEIDE